MPHRPPPGTTPGPVRSRSAAPGSRGGLITGVRDAHGGAALLHGGGAVQGVLVLVQDGRHGAQRPHQPPPPTAASASLHVSRVTCPPGAAPRLRRGRRPRPSRSAGREGSSSLRWRRRERGGGVALSPLWSQPPGELVALLCRSCVSVWCSQLLASLSCAGWLRAL